MTSTNGWDSLNTMLATIPGIVAAVMVLLQHRKIRDIDNAVNGRETGEPTMSEDAATNRRRNEAQDAAAADTATPADPGAADRAAEATAEDPE